MKSFSKSETLTIITTLGAIIAVFVFFTGINDMSEIKGHINNFTNFDSKSNLEANIIVEPPNKLPKDSDFIFEFNICNNGKTGEKYNYSLEIKNIKLSTEAKKEGNGFLNDGESCTEIKYKLYPESKYSSHRFYTDISFSIDVYSESKNKLLLYKNYEYFSNEDGLYELK